ncbi:hypothetical protein GRX01_15690 [Halobaculum sp. WSA2]|uniref:Gins51 C-terminal domain-containing protein n=1 Tax=Halobaculum saliterrae TaxID=2073113 RepID=A0A6B0SZ42_9EURY|nr:hypothetical protein [Halobaculum saliterrae]MXR42776.1 hypothetical protein [Halobaculum saliterrae]
MDLDELRSVQSKERTKDSLQHLRDSFYEDVAAYIAERKRQRDERAASVDQPFSDKQVRKLSNEIETAEEVVESLYERRVGKVVKLASFAAAGAPTDTDGMTVQEAELFEDLVVRIEQNKSRVLDVLEGGADVDLAGDEADAAAAATAPTEATATAAPAGEPESTTPEGGEASAAETPEPAPPERGAEADPTTDASDAGGGPPGGGGDAADGSGVLADAMGGDGSTATDSATRSTTEAQSAAAADAGSTGAGEAESHAGSTGDPDAPPEEFVPGSEPDRAGGANTDSTDATESTASTAPAAGGGSETSADAADRRTVRITRDVGQILGVDEREYELANDDVVTLPTENADPLVERDAAEPIE